METYQSTLKPSIHFEELLDTLPSLTDKTIAITGTTSGTGLVAARTCGALGATVIMLNRPSDRAKNVLESLKEENHPGSFHHVDCDLQDFESVRNSVPEVQSLCESGLDVLCNNAGVMALEDKATKDGFDVQMQTNHLSHFLLTKLLFPLIEQAELKKGEARIVNHSSMARLMVKSLEAKYLEKNGGNLGGNGSLMLIFPGGRWIRYGQTKLANAAFTACLHEKLRRKGSKIKALVAHPGVAQTDLQDTTVKDLGEQNGRLIQRFVDLVFKLYLKMGQSGEDGSLGILRCIAAADVESGEFVGPGMTMAAMKGPARSYPLESYYDNPETRELLWSLSCEATDIEFSI